MELRIKDILKQKEISLVTLSEKTGIEKGNLSNIVNNKKNPTIETLEKIALALDVEISEFFTQKSNSIICPRCGAILEINEK